MILRADSKQTGLHSGWNKRKSGLGGEWVTYLKINFGLRPNAPWAGLGEILKFQPMQTSNVEWSEGEVPSPSVLRQV
jgi:hypothetical protein